MREYVSMENAENVVNPPQKPAVRKNLMFSEMETFSLKPKMTPMRKHPMMLTRKVPAGIIENIFWRL